VNKVPALADLARRVAELDPVVLVTSHGGCSFYRWAGVQARSDSPSVYELVAAGWVPVAHDTRYGSTLCMLEVKPAQAIADENDAASLIFGEGGS
jgi:hypothetical protein